MDRLKYETTKVSRLGMVVLTNIIKSTLLTNEHGTKCHSHMIHRDHKRRRSNVIVHQSSGQIINWSMLFITSVINHVRWFICGRYFCRTRTENITRWWKLTSSGMSRACYRKFHFKSDIIVQYKVTLSWNVGLGSCVARCRLSTSAMQSQKAVTAYLKSEQLLPFGFAWQSWGGHAMSVLECQLTL